MADFKPKQVKLGQLFKFSLGTGTIFKVESPVVGPTNDIWLLSDRSHEFGSTILTLGKYIGELGPKPKQVVIGQTYYWKNSNGHYNHIVTGKINPDGMCMITFDDNSVNWIPDDVLLTSEDYVSLAIQITILAKSGTSGMHCIECRNYTFDVEPNFNEQFVCWSCRDSNRWKYR